eukprot:366022-Chlamydomonas_euryale.AAC.3
MAARPLLAPAARQQRQRRQYTSQTGTCRSSSTCIRQTHAEAALAATTAAVDALSAGDVAADVCIAAVVAAVVNVVVSVLVLVGSNNRGLPRSAEVLFCSA